MRSVIRSFISLAFSGVLASVAGGQVATPEIPSGFTYQGVALDNGSPVTGPVDVTASLYRSPTGGVPVGDPISRTVEAAGGVFSLDLDFGVESLRPPAWLEIALNGQPLSPRTPLTAVPYAVHTRGISVSDDGAVGIGTAFVDGPTGSEVVDVSIGFGSGTNGAQLWDASNWAKGQPQGSGAGPNTLVYQTFVAERRGMLTEVRVPLLRNQPGGRFVGRLMAGVPGYDVNGDDPIEALQAPRIGSSIGVESGDGTVSFPFDDQLEVGATYTFALLAEGGDPATQFATVNLESADPYSGGRVFGSTGTAYTVDRDLIMETEVRPDLPLIATTFEPDGTLTIDRIASHSVLVLDTPQVQISGTLDVDGDARVSTLTLDGGADLAEGFDVVGDVQPGYVVSIDPDRPGGLTIANAPYDKRAAGVISGAGGVRPGLTLGQSGTLAHGEHAVALTGRVYCWVDADANGPVEPGDLLTTSGTPGHAMRATDSSRSFGSTIGKAMTRLESGRGLVLVLVRPQ